MISKLGHNMRSAIVVTIKLPYSYVIYFDCTVNCFTLSIAFRMLYVRILGRNPISLTVIASKFALPIVSALLGCTFLIASRLILFGIEHRMSAVNYYSVKLHKRADYIAIAS